MSKRSKKSDRKPGPAPAAPTPAPSPAPAFAGSAPTGGAPAAGSTPAGATPAGAAVAEPSWLDSPDPRRRLIGKIALVAVWVYVAALWLLALDQTFNWGIFGPKVPPIP